MREFAGDERHLLGQRESPGHVGKMKNQRIEERPLLHLENPRQRRRVQSVAGQTVDRLGRQADHLPFAQQLHRARNRLGRGRSDVIGLRGAGRVGLYASLRYGTIRIVQGFPTLLPQVRQVDAGAGTVAAYPAGEGPL